MAKMAEIMYRIIEKIDGEKGKRIISYRIGQKLKMLCLRYIK